MSGGSVGHLGRADFEAILGFLDDTRELELDTPYPPAYVGQLAGLVEGVPHPLYRENDLVSRRTPLMVAAEGTFVDEADELFWTIGPDVITQYRAATGDLTAARVSDVVGWRRYLDSPVYREYFMPGGVGHMLDLGLPARPGWQRTILFCRHRSDGDFPERDREVLEQLRPHLLAREARAALRRRLRELAPFDEGNAAPDATLTIREREIVFLAAQGRTNNQIAAELWITPATVKKHLENVYDKLGVRSRAAAAKRVSDGTQTWP